jgi:hypothetical protein
MEMAQHPVTQCRVHLLLEEHGPSLGPLAQDHDRPSPSMISTEQADPDISTTHNGRETDSKSRKLAMASHFKSLESV